MAYCVGSTRRSVSSGLHSDEACQSGEETSGKEGERHPRVLDSEAIGQDGEDYGKYYKDYCDDLILLSEVCHRPFAHILRDFFHSYGAFAFFHHLTKEIVGKKQRHNRCGGNQIEKVLHSLLVIEC